MLTLILLATCVPVLAGTVYVATRDKYPQLVADVRGIALQTVIIIVVLLAIAGSVAGVLLTRSGDVTSQLESQEVITGLVSNAASCAAFSMSGVTGTASGTTCTFTAVGGTNTAPTDVTQSRCNLIRGKYTAGTSTSKAKCEVTIS